MEIFLTKNFLLVFSPCDALLCFFSKYNETNKAGKPLFAVTFFNFLYYLRIADGGK